MEGRKVATERLEEIRQFLQIEEPGDHMHYDEYNSLEAGLAGLVIERI